MARNTTGNDTDFINLGNSATLNPAQMSFSCWARATSFPHAYNVLFKRINAGATAYYTWQPKSTGKMAFYYVDNLSTSRSYDGTGTNTLSTGIWYQMGFTINGAAGGIGYVNGAQDGATGGAGIAIASITGNTLIGADSSAANTGWNGRIADAAIWNTALTLAEMAALAKGARPYQIRRGSLVGYWPLDGLSSPEPDLSGNVNNGALTGTSLASGPPIMPFTPRWPQFVPSPTVVTPQIVHPLLSRRVELLTPFAAAMTINPKLSRRSLLGRGKKQ